MNLVQHRLLPLLAAAALLLASIDSSAQEASGTSDADIVFSAGRKMGGYWDVASRLKAVAAESGLDVTVVSSVGSVENLNRLTDPDSPFNLTLTQADALKKYIQEHPRFANHVEILESIGLECVFIVASEQSGIENDQDLQAEKGYRLAIPGRDSGVAVTFDYMAELVPGLANTQPVYIDTLEAMRSFGGPDAPDAIMLVNRPKVLTTEIQLALNNPEKYRLIPVEDRHLADTLPTGEVVYEFLDVPLILRRGQRDRSVPTICTKGLLVTSAQKISPEVRKRLEKIIDFQWMRIYPIDR